MSDSNKNHSRPIAIPPNYNHHHRTRSSSISSSDDDNNSPPLQTPISPLAPKFNPATISPSTSPILSYFLQSPGKATHASANPGRNKSNRSPPLPVLEDENTSIEPPLVKHARRLSTSGWPTGPRFAQPPSMPPTEAQQERGAALLRRLSLGSAALVRPQPPLAPAAFPAAPKRSVTPPKLPPSPPPAGARRDRRSANLSAGARVHRAPSPMGERILKGHFDGFN